eukprot:TRINITY_DN31253_c0_g1_i1.p1 TRINITY_DN31253_c0_g1~~TRINITY_DN31253_c0_g1_i1.p1  ORF type:complete len:1908 (-),score=336.38 TRINITY_DN31253_c0_g1_i1:122-5845(-)
MNRAQFAAASLAVTVSLSWLGFVLLRPVARTEADVLSERRLAADATFLAARKLPARTEGSQRVLQASIQAQHQEKEYPESELLCVCPTTIAAAIVAGSTTSTGATRQVSTSMAGMAAVTAPTISTTNTPHARKSSTTAARTTTTATEIWATSTLAATSSTQISMTQSLDNDDGRNVSDSDAGATATTVSQVKTAWEASTSDAPKAMSTESRMAIAETSLTTTHRHITTPARTAQANEKRQPAGCSDDVEVATLCVEWAAQGECSANPGYMLAHCAKSCDRCPTSTSLPTSTNSSTTSITSTEPASGSGNSSWNATSTTAVVSSTQATLQTSWTTTGKSLVQQPGSDSNWNDSIDSDSIDLSDDNNAKTSARALATAGSHNDSMEPGIEENSTTTATTVVTTMMIVRPTTTTRNNGLVVVSSTTLTVTCPLSCHPYNQTQDGKGGADSGDISTTVKYTTTHRSATHSTTTGTGETAAASTVHVIEGSVEATIPGISDLDAYLSEPRMKTIWQLSLAKLAGLGDEPERVMVALSKATRRLGSLRRAALARLLAAGKLRIDYTITVLAADVAESVKQAFVPAKTADLQNIVKAEIVSMGLNATEFQPILEPLILPFVKEVPVLVSTSAVPAAFEFTAGCVAKDLKVKLMGVTAESCEVTVVKNPDRGTYAGKSETISAFFASGVCGEMALLIHSIPQAFRGMGIVGAVLVGLVVMTWPLVALQVGFRCCRKCCGEPNEITQPGHRKQILILLMSVVGLGGMLAVAFGAFAGDLNGGKAEAESANCAARNFMVSALGDISLVGTGSTMEASVGIGLVLNYSSHNATGRQLASYSRADQDRREQWRNSRSLQESSSSFLGFATARSKALAVSARVEDIKLQAVQAVNNDGGAAASIKDALDLLNFAQMYLGSQFVVEGQQCEFCKNAAQAQSGSIAELLADMNGIPQSILDLGSDLQGKPGSRLGAAGSAFEKSGATMGLVQNSLESGPGGAMVMGDSFFTPALRQASAAFKFGAVPLSGIGLLFLFYGLGWLPCLKRCKIGQKQYPAAQWAACGCCGGCLAALVAGGMTCLCFAIAAVGSDLCIMLETTGTAAGLELYTDLGLVGAQAEVAAARSASLACLSADVASRDIFKVLSLSTHKGTFSALAADVDAVMQPNSMATIRAKLDALATDASSFNPLPATTYQCREWKDSSPAQSCDQTEFKANLRTLSNDLMAASKSLQTGVASMQGNVEWQRLQNSVKGLHSSQQLADLESGLNCETVFVEYQGLQDQVCAGMTTAYRRAGMGWAIAGLLGFVGAFGQWWLWRTLRDNRSLFFDNFEDIKPKGVWQFLACFLAFSVGEAEDSESFLGIGAGSGNTAKGWKGKTDAAVERIRNKYFLAFFDITVEDAVMTYLQNEFFPTYNQAFTKLAVDERVASWKAYEKEKDVLGTKEVMNPGDPPVDPQTILKEYGPDRGPDGLPLRDADDQPLDKNKLTKLRKQLALLQKPWDKWHMEKRKYDLYLLRRIRMNYLKVNAQVEYTDEVAHLQPATPGRTPKAVIVRYVPDDTNRAVWNDELATITAVKTDPKARRDRAVAKKMKGLDVRCFQSPGVYDQLIQKLMVLADDPVIWDGVPVQMPKGVKSLKEPKEPKEPKGLLDPAELFKTGRNEGKYQDCDDQGIPTSLVDGTEIDEKNRKLLEREHERVKRVWDMFQEAKAQYQRDLHAYSQQQSGGSEQDAGLAGVPETQRKAACEVAGLEVVRRLVDKLIFDRGEELALKVNKGLKDPADLARLLVQVEEVGETEDPLLTALRALDKEKRSGLTNIADLGKVFRQLADDELKAGTHISYSEITDEETAYITSRLEKLSMVTDGQVSHSDLKRFLEAPNATEPVTLLGCLCAMRLERFNQGNAVDGLFSARDWRTQLQRGSYRV